MNELMVLYMLAMLVMVVIGAVAVIVCIKMFMDAQRGTYVEIAKTVREHSKEDPEETEYKPDEPVGNRDFSTDAIRKAEEERDLSLRISKPSKPAVPFGEEDN
jgi:hypothetical protein